MCMQFMYCFILSLSFVSKVACVTMVVNNGNLTQSCFKRIWKIIL